MTPGPLLSVAGVVLLLGLVVGPGRPQLWRILTLCGVAIGMGAAVRVLSGGGDWEWRSGFPLGGEAMHLRLDGVSALFLVLVCTVGGGGCVYGGEYWSDHHYPASAPRGRAWWNALLVSLGWVLLSANGLHFLLGWELFTVSAYFLITLDRQRLQVRAAGWLYLVASHTGTVCLFAFFALLAARTGSWDLGPLRGQAGLSSLFWLALLGFGVKAGLFPLHVWLPSAHANAPSHVSAILSGVALKMGVYGIVRFSGWLPVPAASGWVVIGLGSVSALLGIAFSVAQNDFKRMLAYCSVENVGIIFIGVGGAMLAVSHGDAPWGRLAMAGALLHVWNHGAFKSLLFLGAGSVLHAAGTREMSRLGGLWPRMPWTAGLFVLGSVAASGLPPLNGLVSEWLIYLGLFDAVAGRGPAGWAALPAILALATAGALALVGFVKTGALIFLGAPRTRAVARADECGWGMRVPMLALAAVCLAIGLAPVLFWPAVSRAVDAWHPAWATRESPAPLATLGLFQATLGILVATAAAALWYRAKSRGGRRAPTWDCGFRAPTARMQYTAASFAGITAGWFDWILQPMLRWRRPRGLFPTGAFRRESVPETVLERVISPVAAGVLRVSTAVRRLQHGRLQSYILYLVTGLLGLGVLVLLEGAP